MSINAALYGWISRWLHGMSQKTYLTRVLAFGVKYLRPYTMRFVMGIALGFLFGTLNGCFVSASALLMVRLTGHSTANSPYATVMVSSPTVASSAVAVPGGSTGVEPRPTASATGGTASASASNQSIPVASAVTDTSYPVPPVKKKKPYPVWVHWLAKPFGPEVAWLKRVGASIQSGFHSIYVNVIDPFLPLAGRQMDVKQILGGLLLLPILVLLRGGVGYASTYYMAWTSQRLVADLKADVFRKLNTLSLDFFNNSTTSLLLSRITGDTAALNGCLQMGLSDLVKEPITVIGIFTSLMCIDWQLTILAIIFVPLIVVPIRIITKKIRKITQSAYQMDVRQNNLLIDSFANIRIVQAFGLEKQQCDEFVRQNRLTMRMGMRTLQAKEILNPIIELFSAIGLSLVIVFIFYTHRSAASLFAFSVALGMFYTPFKKLASIHLYFVQTELPLKQLMELFAMQPTVRELADPLRLPAFRQGIRLRNASFHYNAGRPVLRGVNIDIPRGHKIGLAGDSGSGKSTLINLLFRFFDTTDGAIEIDGVNIRELSLADLRSHMALVSQDVLLFNTSVADNIGYGKVGATREEIIEAARKAFAHEFIMNMPRGYDTQIGERGVLISGGQRQRLAIARAFVRNSPILVLDEATASLDSQAEAEVQVAIDELASGRTVVCIAHRLSTLVSMNKIYVLRDGEVIESGGFDELLRAGGAFAAMARRQSIVAKAEDAPPQLPADLPLLTSRLAVTQLEGEILT